MFTFTAAPAGATNECRIDGNAFASCNTQRTYSLLSQGEHTFNIRSTNGIDKSPIASRTWTVGHGSSAGSDNRSA